MLVVSGRFLLIIQPLVAIMAKIFRNITSKFYVWLNSSLPWFAISFWDGTACTIAYWIYTFWYWLDFSSLILSYWYLVKDLFMKTWLTLKHLLARNGSTQIVDIVNICLLVKKKWCRSNKHINCRFCNKRIWPFFKIIRNQSDT